MSPRRQRIKTSRRWKRRCEKLRAQIRPDLRDLWDKGRYNSSFGDDYIHYFYSVIHRPQFLYRLEGV